jgi:hypothetical protein
VRNFATAWYFGATQRVLKRLPDGVFRIEGDAEKAIGERLGGFLVANGDLFKRIQV